MSQQPLFSKLCSSQPEAAKDAAEAQIGILLRRYLTQDSQTSFRRHLLLILQDPFARNENGGFRLSALWTGLGILGIFVLSAFLFFNFGIL